MAQFVFLYRRESRPAGSPEQMQQRMQKWQAWFQALTTEGHLKDRGLPLEVTGAVVGGKKSVSDGPYAEKDLVIGFSLVEARDQAHAGALAAGCPICDEGGYVEVRPVMAM